MLLADVNFDASVLAIALAVLGILSNAVSVYVALYVKARIAPIVVQQQADHESIGKLDVGQGRLWAQMNEQGADQANLRGQCQGCKILETVLVKLAELVAHSRKGG